MDTGCLAWSEIDLDAIIADPRMIAERCAHCKPLAVVGMGAHRIAVAAESGSFASRVKHCCIGG